MDNANYDEIINNYIGNVIEIIETNDELLFEIAKSQLIRLIDSTYKIISKNSKTEKINKFLSILVSNSLLQELNTYSLMILNAELKTFIFLKNNTSYLDDFSNKERLISYFSILKNLLKIEFMRRDYVKMNTNVGRTVLANYKLEDINLLLEQTANELNKIDDSNLTLDKKLGKLK